MKQKAVLTKCLLVGFVLLCLHNIGRAQSFSMGYAVPLWGNTTKAVQVNASFDYITTSYIHIYEDNMVDNLGDRADMNFLAVFLTPTIDKEVIGFMPEFLTIGPMAGIMNKPFPNENGRHLHFGISIFGEVLDNMDIYYMHISNGYLGITNVGIDTFGVRVKL